MNLHKDKIVFEDTITDIKKKTNIEPVIIEKDYYVVMFLEALSKKLPSMIFKGGTSLSKCYNIIKRFSEDIDITVERTGNLTQGQYKKIKQAVVDTAFELGLNILNLDDTRSRRDFNQYKIDYSSMFSVSGIKDYLLVETTVSVRSFPTEAKTVKSIVQEYLEEQGLQNMVQKYGLHEYSVRTQKLDRTLIDKLFALGDYYMIGREAGYSRHIYDIHKILPAVAIDSVFKALVAEVREARKVCRHCRSAQDGVDTQKLLEEIAAKNFYKKDYEESLSVLIHEDVPYSEARKSLLEIISKKVF